MRTLLAFALSILIFGGLTMAGESLPKWSARIRLEGKGPSVAVEVSAKDRPAARRLILAQYGDKTVFTSGPVRARESQ